MYQNQYYPPYWHLVIPPLPLNSDNDIIINNSSSLIPGPQGPQGPQGEVGPQGPQGPSGTCSCNTNCIVIKEDYQALNTDWYIGVENCKSIIITLPKDAEECSTLVVKSHKKQIGNKKVYIVTGSQATIDGEPQIVLQSPYESVELIFVAGNWYIISQSQV